MFGNAAEHKEEFTGSRSKVRASVGLEQTQDYLVYARVYSDSLPWI